MLKTYAKVFGFVLLILGILGFVPALTPNGHLLGIFQSTRYITSYTSAAVPLH